MGGGRGPQRNQPKLRKLTFRNHSWLLYQIGQTKPKCVFRVVQMLQKNFYKIFIQQIFYCLTHLLTYCCIQSNAAENWLQQQPHSFSGNALNFMGRKPFTILIAYVHALFCSNTVIALNLLYGDHSFTIRFLSKVKSSFTHRFKLPIYVIMHLNTLRCFLIV